MFRADKPTIDGALEAVRSDPQARFAALLAAVFAFSIGFVLGFTIASGSGEDAGDGASDGPGGGAWSPDGAATDPVPDA